MARDVKWGDKMIKKLTNQQVKDIAKLTDKKGVLVKDNGKFFNFATLGAYLFKAHTGTLKVSKNTRDLEAAYIKDVQFLIYTGFLKVKARPYSLLITEKIKTFGEVVGMPATEGHKIARDVGRGEVSKCDSCRFNTGLGKLYVCDYGNFPGSKKNRCKYYKMR